MVAEEDTEKKWTAEEVRDKLEKDSPPIKTIFFIFKLILIIGLIFFGTWAIMWAVGCNPEGVGDFLTSVSCTIQLIRTFDAGDLIIGPDNDLEISKDYVQDLNIKILDLESPGSPYLSGESILIRGSFEADTLGREEIFVDLSCKLSGYNGSIVVNPSFLVIPLNEEKFRRSISCTFEEGIITDKVIRTEIAKVIVRFDTVSRSKYDVYVLTSQEYETSDNPFSEYGIYPDSLMANNKMEVEVLEGGPVMIDIFVDEIQPLKEGEEYIPLEVTLKDMSSVGYIFSLQDLRLKLSSNLELSADEDFCDFEAIGSGSGGYNLFGLRQEIIDERVNEVCNENALSDLRMSLERCAQEFKSEFSFKCDLITKELYGEDGNFVQNAIIAELEYTFEVMNSVGLKIKNVIIRSGV